MKKFVSIVILLVTALFLNAQERKKVGVVLSGGGAKGVAHIRVLKVLEEEGIPIDYIAGTSMGAVVGGFYSIGYTPHQLDSLIMHQDWPFLLSDRTRRKIKTFEEKEEDSKYILSLPFINSPKEIIPDGIIKGQNLENIFNMMTIGKQDSVDFNTFSIPFACVAVDLVKGEEVVFHSGRLVPCIRASMAIPGAFTPMRIDSMVLVDGGLVNNYPADVAKAMGADIIIGVDVQNDEKEDDKVNTVADVVGKMSDMLSRDKYAQNLKITDLHIKVDVEGYTAASFNLPALDTLLNRGQIAADNKREELRELKKIIGISENYIIPEHGPYPMLSKNNPMRIRKVIFKEVGPEEAARLITKTKLQDNSAITLDDLNNAVDAIYATQIYNNVNYSFHSVNDDSYDLIFMVQQDVFNSFRLGFRLDTEEIASVLLNAKLNFNTKIPTRAIATGRFGKRTGLRLDFEVLPDPLRFFNFAYSYQYNDINIYDHGSREYSTNYDRHLIEVGYNHIFNQNLKLETGIHYEHFDYKNFLFKNQNKEFNYKSQGYFSYNAGLRWESLDIKTYPTRGISMKISTSLFTDNLFKYKDNDPFGEITVLWKKPLTPAERFTVTPAAYGRVLIGKKVAYPYLNSLGGMVAGRYVPQQIPFAGINYMEIVGNSVVVAQMQLRQRFGNNHYVFLTGNYGVTDKNLGDVFNGEDLIGGNIGYSYNSIIGPLEASFNYSNRTRKVGFYLNIGYIF